MGSRLSEATDLFVELTGAQAEPAEEPTRGQFGALRPVIHVVDDLVSDVVGNPCSS